jgi:hypothetical protein
MSDLYKHELHHLWSDDQGNEFAVIDVGGDTHMVRVTSHKATCSCKVCDRGRRQFSSRILSTRQVAEFFVARAHGFDREAQLNPCWAPAAQRSFALVAIGGVDQLTPVGTVPDRNQCGSEYAMFDLTDAGIPMGFGVYRVTCERTLYLFQRLNSHSWELKLGTWCPEESEFIKTRWRAFSE